MTVARLDANSIAGWRVLSAAGDLDWAAVPTLRQVLFPLLDSGAEAVVVDLSGTAFLDCSCVTVLLDAVRQARSTGLWLRVIGERSRVRRVLEITGALAELGIRDESTAGGHAGQPGREHAGRDSELEKVEAVLAARAVLADGDPRRQLLRDLAVECCLPLADRLAGQYHVGKQQLDDDLSQVATVGLIHAVDRYDPARGARFLSFALPTILGEVRRYFRDRTWNVHVPRHLQELRLSINHVTEAMTQQLRRTPTEAELAEQLAVPREEVREAMVAAAGYAPASLSRPVGDGSAMELGDLIGGPDPDLDRVDNRESLGRLIATLPERERQVLAYRFSDNLTQVQVARLIGVSQMQVSRLQSRALARLRTRLLTEE